MSSFELINYNIRVNKSIERKMICEVLNRLSLIDTLNNYRYIGFGATYFADFNLIHKQLGITDLTSIEAEEEKRERFELNKPFDCIKMIYGTSTEVLPNYDLHKKKNIIWLDYDGVVKDYIFSDINTIVSNSIAGSVFLFSVNVELPRDKRNKKKAIEVLKERVGEERIPVEFLQNTLNPQNYIKLVYQMIDRQIKKSLSIRNGTNENQLEYKQVFNFLYKDGAAMLTVGGIIYNNSQKQAINKMKLEELKYFRSNEDIYRISCPNLTYKEIQLLNSLLPCDFNLDEFKNITNENFKEIPIDSIDIINYAEVYRYYPNYAETNI